MEAVKGGAARPCNLQCTAQDGMIAYKSMIMDCLIKKSRKTWLFVCLKTYMAKSGLKVRNSFITLTIIMAITAIWIAFMFIGKI